MCTISLDDGKAIPKWRTLYFFQTIQHFQRQIIPRVDQPRQAAMQTIILNFGILVLSSKWLEMPVGSWMSIRPQQRKINASNSFKVIPFSDPIADANSNSSSTILRKVSSMESMSTSPSLLLQ
ncbi:hypothetical protein ACH5RR_000091 [Cinchona calisaya]|uniref:Uncharacterized protein n=1 Tax=Cinchona calisaya TaxID=153742 RepID=A0ABD3AZM1_9GENT